MKDKARSVIVEFIVAGFTAVHLLVKLPTLGVVHRYAVVHGWGFPLTPKGSVCPAGQAKGLSARPLETFGLALGIGA